MTKVYLIEALPRLLTAYPEDLSERAKKDLESLGVKIYLNTMVTDVNDEGVSLKDKFIPTKNIDINMENI